MIETPTIVQTAAIHTAYIHLVVPRAEIQSVMGATIREVFAAVVASGQSPAGPWFTHHLRPPGDAFDFEVCVPVAAPFSQSGRVRAGEWPAMRVARTVYSGPYDGLAAAWPKLHAWMAENALRAAADLYERYLVGPEATSDPAALRTELSRPIADAER